MADMGQSDAGGGWKKLLIIKMDYNQLGEAFLLFDQGKATNTHAGTVGQRFMGSFVQYETFVLHETFFHM